MQHLPGITPPRLTTETERSLMGIAPTLYSGVPGFKNRHGDRPTYFSKQMPESLIGPRPVPPASDPIH